MSDLKAKSYDVHSSASKYSSNRLKIEKEKIKVYFGKNNPNLTSNNVYGDNTLTTTRYNIITWAPKSLLIQFRRIANIYFLVVTVLTCLWFSPIEPSSMIGTFIFVLFATMIKEGIEDYKRYKQDWTNNNRITNKLNNSKWEEVKCWTLKPGDIVKLSKDEECSTDMIIVKSSNLNGYCYVDTKNLDGETNLKEKGSLEDFKDIDENNISITQGTIVCDKPDEIITHWDGVVKLDTKEIFTNMKNLMLKGCVLKNTDYCIGLIVYVGKNTKIMKNSKNPQNKFSNVFKIMNNILYSVFMLDILICVIFSIYSIYWNEKEAQSLSYIIVSDKKESYIFRFLIGFLVFFVSFSQIIPISLYVGLEVVKILQGLMIYYDAEIYDKIIKKPSQCRTIDLIEELGQVEFIFSDKTGTLTQNNMIMKKCYVGDKFYGGELSESENENFTLFGDPLPSIKLKSSDARDKIDREKLEDFFYLLSLCHSVFREQVSQGNHIFQGSSPDDIALVKGSQQVGIEFLSKEFTEITILNKLIERKDYFELKIEFPFDSDRKRMSVVVIDKQINKYILLSKGADTTMLPRLNADSKSIEEYKRVIKAFSREGLRVLVTAKRTLNEAEYLEWENTYLSKKKNGQKDFNSLYEGLENNLEFVGLTAIEDKLQEGVPDTIYTLLTCNIKIWVLTGDKQDTAEEIAKSCKLISDNMIPLYLFDNEDGYNVEKKLREFYQNFDLPFDENELPSAYLRANNMKLGNNFNSIDIDDEKELFKYDVKEFSNKIRKKSNKDLTIVIDGASLDIILSDEILVNKFFYLSMTAKSVVCCRVSPKQKAKVVELAKKYGKWITLSIGDGANDVPMIMEAHIGVGIQGKEGTQAVRSADISIGQFRFLEKLLLIYGRSGYMKISKFICYYFYKNIILVFTEFFFKCHNGFSGQIFFADYLSTMYNAFFTSWPCLFTFSLERDVDLPVVKKFPFLYEAGQMNYYFNIKVFWSYILAAILHGALAFYLPVLGMVNSIDVDGKTFNHWYKSCSSYTIIIKVVTFKLLVVSDFWNKINLLACFFSIIFYFVVLLVLTQNFLGSKFQPEIEGLIDGKFSIPINWIMIMISPFIILLPDITLKQIIYNIFPDPLQSIKKNLLDPEFRRRVIDKENKNVDFNNPVMKQMDYQLAIILKKKVMINEYGSEDHSSSIMQLQDNFDQSDFSTPSNSKIKALLVQPQTKTCNNLIKTVTKHPKKESAISNIILPKTKNKGFDRIEFKSNLEIITPHNVRDNENRLKFNINEEPSIKQLQKDINSFNNKKKILKSNTFMFKQKNEKTSKSKLFSNLKKPLNSIEEIVGNSQDQLNENGSERGSYNSLKSIKKLRNNNPDNESSKSKIHFDIKGSSVQGNIEFPNKSHVIMGDEEIKQNTDVRLKSLFATSEVKSSHISDNM